MKYLFVFVIVLCGVTALSPEPLAKCTSPSLEYLELPISVQEVQRFNLNQFLIGFNLEFSLSSTAPGFAYLREKVTEKKKTDIAQPGLKSYHLEHKGNDWGKELITLSEEGFKTKIRWGFTSANETVPTLDEEVTVQNDEKITCYDAILFRHEHMAIVDCVKKSTFGLKNIFMYVNTTSQTVLQKTKENDMYVGFSTITRRRMVSYMEDDYQYLIRAYYANGVDEYHRDNTYIEILSANDVFNPRTLKVMDRSFLHQKQLAITDFKMYNGLMYVLDYYNGISVLGLTPAQNVLVMGRYRTDGGYTKMGMYTGNLDHEILFVLANHHAIYEIDFSNQLQPKVIAKYSLMQGAQVSSLWVNRYYVIAQVSANVTNATNGSDWYNVSITFNRGARTYMNAYTMMPHSSNEVIVDMNRQHNLFLVMDQQSMVTYHLDQPILSLMPTSTSDEGKEFSFSVQGVSVNPYTGHKLPCSFTMKFVVVDKNKIDLYPTGLSLPDTYYANYPGEMFIDLAPYVLGPNITYKVDERTKQGEQLSAYWILQQNTTHLQWPKQPSFSKITFLRQEQYDSIDETDLFIYTQDYTNMTHLVQCTTVPYTDTVTCNESGHRPEIDHRILNLTANRFHYYEGKHAHLAAVVFDGMANEVFIYHVEADDDERQFRPIMFPDTYEGRVTSVEFLKHYLVVVLKYMKQIRFYNMIQCLDHQERQCKLFATIDTRLMNYLGIDYFSPVEVYSSIYHPYVLFIQNLDSVIILDITFPAPVLLAHIKSPGTQEPGFQKWKMAISRDSLVLVNPPNIIEEHSLFEIFKTKDAMMVRTYPIFNYTIPDSFDLDFSDQGDLIYITAEDKNLPDTQNSVILVYRAGLPAASVFYDVFHINGKYDDMLIDATGNFGDYVSVTLGSMLTIFRQYQQPILVFDDSYNDFEFNITYGNDPQSMNHTLVKALVKVSNYIDKLVINDSKLNETDYLTDQIEYQHEDQTFILNDSTWFTGNVINYTLEGCDECGDKVNVINHLEDKRDFITGVDMSDYVFTIHGGLIQQSQTMISMRHNGSIQQFISMPAMFEGENCQTTAYSMFYDFAVSACNHRDQIYLYITEFHSFKPFVNGPYPSSAQAVSKVQMMEDIMILVDVDQNTSTNSVREGGVLIYALNHQVENPELFDELEFIDTMDLEAASGWKNGPVYISNADLIYTNITNTYRLVITEIFNGLFFVDFTWTKGRKAVEITSIEFYDMRSELNKLHLPLPNNAFFQAVTVHEMYHDPLFKYWEVNLIVTTKDFHIFQVFCNFDKTGILLHSNITHIYYRYGFYETKNYLKSFDGYFAVAQKVPNIYKNNPLYSKQVLTVYDSRERWQPLMDDSGIPASYMLGGISYPEGRVSFDFNFTFVRNETDPFRDIGLLLLHERQAFVKQIALHDYIAIQTKEGISYTQNAVLRANNDFSTIDLPIDVIVNSSSLPGWAIALIVIGCLLAAGLGGFVAWRLYMKRKPKSEIKKSLLEEQGQNGEQASSEGGGEEQSGQEFSSEQKSDEKSQDRPKSEEEQPVKVIKQVVEPVSINRETITSLDEGEKIEEPREELKPVEEKKQDEDQ